MKTTLKYIEKFNIIHITIILAAIIAGFILFHENIYSPYSDIGREFYIPRQINEGYSLYKDIFNVYAPLGYIINSFFVKLRGNTFQTYYFIGLFCSVLCIIPIFLISKEYTNKNIALFISLFIIFSCTYYPSISNWITPYSYSILYALCGLLWSFFFLYKYINEDKNIFLYLSWFCFGFSLCCKYEYIAFFVILIISMIYKKTKTNTYIKSFAVICIIPFLTFILLLIQKCTIGSIILSFKYIFQLSGTVSLKWFYICSGLIPSKSSFYNAFLSLTHPHFVSIFYSLGYICILLILYILLSKNRKQKEDFLLLILILTAVLTSLKTIGGISLEIYGTCFLPLLFISLCAFLYRYLPEQKKLILTIVCSALFVSYFINDIKQNNLEKIETEKGDIRINPVFAGTTKELIKYINENTKPSDKVLILPEGAIINHITNRNSDDYLFYLIPPNCEIFKDKYIIERIAREKPGYIAVSNIQYPWYNQKSFSKSFGKNIFEFIKDTYNLETVIGNEFKFYIYKLK